MADQFSTCCTGLLTSPLCQWLEYFPLVMAAVQLSSTWKNAYNVKSDEIADHGHHQYSALNDDPWPLWYFLIRSKLNGFSAVVKSWFTQGENVMSGSLLLDPEPVQ
jgi:hypothetical protein